MRRALLPLFLAGLFALSACGNMTPAPIENRPPPAVYPPVGVSRPGVVIAPERSTARPNPSVGSSSAVGSSSGVTPRPPGALNAATPSASLAGANRAGAGATAASPGAAPVGIGSAPRAAATEPDSTTAADAGPGFRVTPLVIEPLRPVPSPPQAGVADSSLPAAVTPAGANVAGAKAPAAGSVAKAPVGIVPGGSAGSASPASSASSANSAGSSASASAPGLQMRPDMRAASEGDSNWMWPTAGRVVQAFEPGKSKGLILSGNLGDPVLAAADGKVIFSGPGPRGYGNLIIVKHPSDLLSVYAHNKAVLVKEGAPVQRGQRIADLGDTDSDRPKLHFEVRRQGRPIDPLQVLPPR